MQKQPPSRRKWIDTEIIFGRQKIHREYQNKRTTILANRWHPNLLDIISAQFPPPPPKKKSNSVRNRACAQGTVEART